MTRKRMIERQKQVALKYATGRHNQQDLAKEFSVTQSTISRDVKFGGLMILAECGIRDTDSIDDIRRKATKAGYAENSNIIVRLSIMCT